MTRHRLQSHRLLSLELLQALNMVVFRLVPPRMITSGQLIVVTLHIGHVQITSMLCVQPALTVSSSLSSIATSRATNIMATADFSHNGQQTAGEILEAGAGSASVACQDWQNSSGHYALITSTSFTQMGIGCAFTRDGYTCWCVTFS